jgi:hypothetical protein
VLPGARLLAPVLVGLGLLVLAVTAGAGSIAVRLGASVALWLWWLPCSEGLPQVVGARVTGASRARSVPDETRLALACVRDGALGVLRLEHSHRS